MAIVRFKGVTKQFGEVTAVNRVSFDTADGEFLCLLGPSGCGKTTTLRLIAGLESANSGQIYIGDRDVTKLSPKDRDIGMVFQDYALYPHMSILENIAYPLKVRKVEEKQRTKQAELIASNLQIENLMKRLPGQISGGQQQRTSVARAVVHEPQVFLFDEPLSNLDAKLRLESRGFLKQLQQKLGVTAVYVTHDQAEAMAIADRIAVMQNGHIIQMGPPLEVYRYPKTTFVANFLGSPPMNLLDAVYRKGRFEAELFSFDSPFDHSKLGIADNTPVILGVRPEHLFLSDGSDNPVIPGEVYAMEALGPETLLSFLVGNQLCVCRVFGDDPPAVQDRLKLQFNPKHLHLFDQDGMRVDVS